MPFSFRVGKKTSQERLVERCIFITYIQDNTLNIYINHYCVSYTTPNFRLDQFDLKYSHQAETSLCFIPKASAHGSFAGYEIERPQYQRENVCVYTRESFSGGGILGRLLLRDAH